MSIPSAVIIGGLSSGHPRHDADFYPTPWECTAALMARFGDMLPGPVWEPACGDGAICRHLGRAHIATDLHDRGYGEGGVDFLASRRACGSIITNPPFKIAEAFIRHARTFDVPFAMLLKATYWHSARRQALFRETGPAAVAAMTWRPNFVPDRGSAPPMDCIWTVWSAAPADRCEYVLLPKPTMPAHGVFA